MRAEDISLKLGSGIQEAGPARSDDQRKHAAPSSTGQDSHVTSRKLQKVCAGQSPGRAATAQSQLALLSITQLLIEAHGINTNAGTGRYKQVIQEAREIAATTRDDSSLSWRIRAA